MKIGSGSQIATPTELIERLKRNPDVLGALQYGSSIRPDGADTDICVVVAHRPEALESVHFWIGAGPVDMNLRTLDELRDGGVAELPGLDDVLREGIVLYERQPGLLGNIVAKSSLSPSQPSPPDPADMVGMRHGHAHVLHKLDYHKDRDPLLCNVLLAGATHWLLRAYAAARGLPYRGEKATLKAIRQNDPDLLAELEQLASVGAPLTERIEALRRLTGKVLEPVGGPWQEGEVLFFSAGDKNPPATDEWSGFLTSLLHVGENGVEGSRNGAE